MSKILIHIGPHKTGSSHLQRFFIDNSEALSKRSIDYLGCRLKEGIRNHFRVSKKGKSQDLIRKNTLQPWYSYYPDSCFVKESSHDHAILSEEALFRLLKYGDEILSFDQFLSRWYVDRAYLAVMREINSHTISRISQSIKAARRFSYKDCAKKLEEFSLDRAFAGCLDMEINLIIATFGNLVAGSQSTKNVSILLEDVFTVAKLDLKQTEGKSNTSLGSEGTAIRIAYNNVMQMVLGKKRLAKSRRAVLISGRLLERKIRDVFPSQQMFCPYTKDEQLEFHDHHLARSQEFIKRYPGSWVDEVFTPAIRAKSIVLLSEFEAPDKRIAFDLLKGHVQKTLDELPVESKPHFSFSVNSAVRYFLMNEKKLVL